RINVGLPAGTPITNQAAIGGANLPQPLASNPVTTTVLPLAPALAGTWTSLPLGAPAPNQDHASLTVDPQGRFTVWARSADGQTIAHGAQGVLRPDGSFDVTGSDGVSMVHFTGQISPDRQTA